MKILRITLENLASLEGRHTVDFTRDPLRSTGLYSIIGPTGAGKSTLLDALCLSLYDDTPRLHAIRTKTAKMSEGETQNDPRTLLRRGAVSGFAETAFVGVDGQTYTARWQVRRARNKADGALQKADMVLYSGNIEPGTDGIVVEGEKKTLVTAAIEQRIGLTFSQFTRAVMLAQNDFAAFLKTDDKERAAILEALTGTEAFTKISSAIFQRCRDEEKKLEELELKLGSNEPLSEEARAAAEEVRDKAQKSLNESRQQLETHKKTLAWFQQLHELEKDRDAAQQADKQAADAERAAEPRKIELELCQRVLLEAQPLRIRQKQADDNSRAATDQLKDCTGKLNQAEQTLRDAIEATKQAESIYNDLIKSYEEQLKPELIRARELDASLKPLKERVNRAQEQKVRAEQQQEKSREVLRQWEGQLREESARRVELQRLLDSDRLKAVVPFAAESKAWLQSLRQLEDALKKLRETENQVQQKKRAIENRQPLLQKSQNDRDASHQDHKLAELDLRDADEKEQQIDAAELDKKSTQLNTSTKIIGEFELETKMYLAAQHALNEKTQKLKTAEENKQHLQQRIADERDLPTRAEADLQTAQQMLEQMRAAIDDHAKRLRTLLRDNEPCPVCGSESHPWQQQEPDFDSIAIKTVEKQVAGLKKRRDEAVTASRLLDNNFTNCQTEVARIQAAIETDLAKLQTFSWKHSDDPFIASLLLLPLDDRLQAIHEISEDLKKSIEVCEQQRQDVRELQQTRAKCQERLNTAATKLRELQEKVRDLERDDHADRAALKLLEQNLSSEGRVVTEQQQDLAPLWSAVPDGPARVQTNPTEFREDLQQRFNDCLNYSGKLQTVKTNLTKLEAAREGLQKSLEQAEERQKAAVAELQQAEQQYDVLAEERQSLLNGRQVADVEAEFTDARKAADQVRSESSRQQTLAANNRVEAKTNEENAARRVEETREDVERSAQALTNWLTVVNETQPQLLTINRIDEIIERGSNWLKREQDELDALNRTAVKTKEALQGIQKRHADHLSTRSTEQDEQTVQNLKTEQESLVQDLEKQLDAAKAPLNIDDLNRQKNKDLAAQLDKQRDVAKPWQKLNELVGSSDGTKFSRIAQTITLDLLLKDANYQLSNLAPRYRLERLPESLNLVIVDRDMADERRSVHSLSGGESFLVSLALALGLAALTSNRMRIESLFIDEGFGSLDEDTLALAMNALMQLEAQGRKVGIITHVTQMKDVIPVQIQVRRTRGGASAIHIPGT